VPSPRQPRVSGGLSEVEACNVVAKLPGTTASHPAQLGSCLEWQKEPFDFPAHRDPADPIAVGFDEPKPTVWSDNDVCLESFRDWVDDVSCIKFFE
jgi:hypothetical protein